MRNERTYIYDDIWIGALTKIKNTTVRRWDLVVNVSFG
jgi:hypothetical protein